MASRLRYLCGLALSSKSNLFLHSELLFSGETRLLVDTCLLGQPRILSRLRYSCDSSNFVFFLAPESNRDGFPFAHSSLEHLDYCFFVAVAHIYTFDGYDPVVFDDLPGRRRVATLHTPSDLASDFAVGNVRVVVREAHAQPTTRWKHDFELKTYRLSFLAFLIFDASYLRRGLFFRLSRCFGNSSRSCCLFLSLLFSCLFDSLRLELRLFGKPCLLRGLCSLALIVTSFLFQHTCLLFHLFSRLLCCLLLRRLLLCRTSRFAYSPLCGTQLPHLDASCTSTVRALNTNRHIQTDRVTLRTPRTVYRRTISKCLLEDLFFACFRHTVHVIHL